MKAALQSAIDGVTDVGNSIGDGFNSAGNAIKHTGEQVIDGIGSKYLDFMVIPLN